MLLHVTTAYPEEPHAALQRDWLRAGAAANPGGHALTDDPAAADAILFAELNQGGDPLFLRVLRHPLRRRFPRKSFLYHDADFAFPFVRGLYPSVRRADADPRVCRPVGYLARIEFNAFVQAEPPVPPRFLYSFAGAGNCDARRRLLALRDDRAHLVDTSGQALWDPAKCTRDDYCRNYAGVMRDSLFVLCPRGVGPSSYRLFETMQMGRAPVIVADDWTPPRGPDWASFSLTVAERDVAGVPALLRAREAEAVELGRRARQAWVEWFSREAAFQRVAGWCAELLAEPYGAGTHAARLLPLLRPGNARPLLRFLRQYAAARQRR